MKKSTIAIVILVLVILLLTLGLGGTVFYFTDPLDIFNNEISEETEPSASETSTSQDDESTEVEEEEEDEPEEGTISGSVGYPSEYIPEDMQVCAESVSTTDEYCETIEEGDDYTYGWGYEIEVPFGDYNVYSQLPGDDYQAYYSEFVTCGLDVSCPSHDPIDVTVDSSNLEVTDIDPIDWYAN